MLSSGAKAKSERTVGEGEGRLGRVYEVHRGGMFRESGHVWRCGTARLTDAWVPQGQELGACNGPPIIAPHQPLSHPYAATSAVDPIQPDHPDISLPGTHLHPPHNIRSTQHLDHRTNAHHERLAPQPPARQQPDVGRRRPPRPRQTAPTGRPSRAQRPRAQRPQRLPLPVARTTGRRRYLSRQALQRPRRGPQPRRPGARRSQRQRPRQGRTRPPRAIRRQRPPRQATRRRRRPPSRAPPLRLPQEHEPPARANPPHARPPPRPDRRRTANKTSRQRPARPRRRPNAHGPGRQ